MFFPLKVDSLKPNLTRFLMSSCPPWPGLMSNLVRAN
jgi:hypothetical protein